MDPNNPQGFPTTAPQGTIADILTQIGLLGGGEGGMPLDPAAPSPALGLTMIQKPEAIAGHLAASGVAPPADQPEGVTSADASKSLGAALSPPPEGTPSQQGAPDTVPLPQPRPTPAPETANDQGAATPEADTSASPGETQDNVPLPQPRPPAADAPAAKPSSSSSKSSPVDDLAKALAGLKPIPVPPPPTVRTPEGYRPTNQISRSNLPSVLLQQLANVTHGTTGPYRLGQALSGIRGQ